MFSAKRYYNVMLENISVILFFVQGVSFRPEMGDREIDKTFNFRAKNRLKVIEREFKRDLQKERFASYLIRQREKEGRKRRKED